MVLFSPHAGIAARLSLAFVVPMMLALAGIGLGMLHLGNVAADTRQMMAEPVARERLIQEWARNIAAGVRRTTAIAMSNEKAVADFFAADQAAATKASADLQKKIEALLSDSTETRRLYDQVHARRKVYIAARDEVIAAKKAGDSAKAQALLTQKFAPAMPLYLEAVNALVRNEQSLLDAQAMAIEQRYRRSLKQQIGLSLGLVLAVMAFGWWMTRSITAPLQRAVRLAERIAKGNLRVRVREAGPQETVHLQRSMGQMADQLRNVIAGIRDSSDSIARGSEALAHGSGDLSERTQAQAVAVGQTSQTVSLLSQSVQENTESAITAQRLATAVSELATRGDAAVQEVHQAMQDLQHSAQVVRETTGLIDNISFQTNVLALNAAIEAARAGPGARGFSVVAGEVRNLARRAQEASNDIRVLVVKSVEQSKQGRARAEQASHAMKETLSAALEMAEHMTVLRSSSESQSDRIHELSAAMTRIDGITQENAALVDHTNSLVSGLRDQVVSLRSEVKAFEV